ncbi:MAG: polymer-forming cytoskeletal protein [Gammaproteobacteria bacterium]|nr:polymer-forming cytoskeletal protein [Gammaproteobacteria bacterium]
MLSKSKRKKAAKIDTLIGSHTEIRGDVIFTGGLHVDGKVKGNVIAESGSGSVISLSEKGVIEGEVHVPNVIVNGMVIGDVYSDTHIELAEKARIKGNVYYSYIEMARGSEVNGSLVHQEGGKSSQKQNRETTAADDGLNVGPESTPANP